MQKVFKRFAILALVLSLVGTWGAGIALSAALSSTEAANLDKRFSPSMAAKVQLGTKLLDAQTGAYLDPTLMKDSVLREASVTLSQANILAMNGAAVTLLAAPGAGKVIIVDTIEFFHDYATTAYADGGDVTIEYETSGVDINVFDVALVTATADDNWLIRGTIPYVSAAGTASHFSLTSSANKAVKITNATGAFTGGNAANIIKLRIRYHVITLLT